MAKKNIYTEESLRLLGLVKQKDGTYSRPKTVQQPREKLTQLTTKEIEDIAKKMTTEKITTQRRKVEVENPIVDFDWNCGEPILLTSNDKHLITFDVDPMGKPRMTQSDKWKKREATSRYWIFKNKLQLQAKGHNFKMPESNIHMIFRIEMPQSWEKSKKLEMLNKPHQQKPDADNILKGVQDSLCDDDSYIWDVRISKLWDWKGSISIYNIV